jgi:hypothetical protein
MHIKTTLRFHLTLVRIPTIKNTTIHAHVSKCRNDKIKGERGKKRKETEDQH